MKKVATLAALVMAAFSAQAVDLYLYAGAGLKEPVEKLFSNLKRIQVIKLPWNMVVRGSFWRVIIR